MQRQTDSWGFGYLFAALFFAAFGVIGLATNLVPSPKTIYDLILYILILIIGIVLLIIFVDKVRRLGFHDAFW